MEKAMTDRSLVRRHCDMDRLLESLGGNQAMARKLARMFLGLHPRLTGKLDEALQQWDVPALCRAVHDIRGSCVLFSAEPCLSLARALEETLSQGGGPGVRDDCVRLRATLDEMARELNGYLADAKPGGQHPEREITA